MPRIYTKKSMQHRRKALRNNMTQAEQLLWPELRAKKLGVRFLRQYSISSYVVDFYCPELKLAIEVDGDTHNSPDAIEYDKDRESAIGNLNIKFLRFLNEEVYVDINSVIHKIKNEIE